MFEFVFTQLTKANTQSRNKFDSSMIFTIKNVIEGWPDKFQYIDFNSTVENWLNCHIHPVLDSIN